MKGVFVQNNAVKIRNSAGVSVHFENLEDAVLYTGENFSIVDGKRITYQPDEGIHVWDTVRKQIPFQPLEDLIDNVQIYRDRLDDPYFNLTLAEAKVYKISQEVMAARIAKRQEFASGQNRLSSDGLQSLEDIQTQALLAAATGDSAWRINVILENTNTDGTNKRMELTAAQALGFVKSLWQRNEAINQAAQDRVDVINGMTDIELIKVY